MCIFDTKIVYCKIFLVSHACGGRTGEGFSNERVTERRLPTETELWTTAGRGTPVPGFELPAGLGSEAASPA